MSASEICFKSAGELAALIRKGMISPVETINNFLSRIEDLDPNLNAFTTVAKDSALQAAKEAERAIARGAQLGALHGVPVAVKDLLFTAGVRTTGGSRIYEQFVPGMDAVVVQRMRAAGAILIGKTNTPEFGFKSTTESAVGGTTNNPWNPARTAGGSSGGSAVAVACGFAPIAIGTDAGGSIRTPASFCGIVGFKPTFGRVPNGSGFGGGESLVHTGPMTRSVADAVLMMDVIAGTDERDRHSAPHEAGRFSNQWRGRLDETQIAYSADLGYAAVDPEVAAVVANVASKLAQQGYRVDEANLALDDPQAEFNTIIRAENYVFARDLLVTHGDLLDPENREFTQNGASISAFEYLSANRARDRLSRQLAILFERCDLLLTPTLAVAPFPHGERPMSVNGRKIQGMSWLSFTYPFNLSGHPAVSVPCGWTADHLPIGVQIIGRRFEDGRVLRAASAVEALQGDLPRPSLG